eukprot:CAMPEP_0119004226 /NCGR_PEP_ID=MMETSP1176-20130426/1028_1 /TAXON_ID=265551 /ORGANISM="Synedropsis recta cf, Strain CCMP1620" /LENGTH=163 /DNA_ID=CAMNT_0006955911 /DNA_START=17 /DNA_END=508 /DNA_ORIENTATION=+
MVETNINTNKFTHAQYLGPANDQESDIVVLDEADFAPGIATATPIAGCVAARIGTTSTDKGATTTTTTISTATYTVPAPGAPDRFKMKKLRKRRKIVAGVIGGTVGLIILGPLGAIGIGIGSALVVKHSDRASERRLLRCYNDRMVRHQAATINVPVYMGHRA